MGPCNSTTSPKLLAPDPNLNPFSPLSPDLVENKLNDNDASAEMNTILGIGPYRKDVVFYSRRDLLRIGKRCHNALPPRGMETHELWFGLRRQPEGPDPGPVDNRSYGGQMGRFSVRTPGIRLGGEEVKKERRKEDEWRKPERNPPRDPRRPNWQQREDESSEPAWMDDTALEDPAIAQSSDPLIKFIPGEDMIAAHKRAMKARDVGGDWRGEGFFGSDPAIASSSAPLGAPPSFKSKPFNAANYLTQARDASDEETSAKPATSAFTSRFQKFFGAPESSAEPESLSRPAPSPHETQEEPRDERMARLMGLLSTKVRLEVTDSADSQSPEQESPRDTTVNVSPNSYPGQFRPPNPLLQQLYGNPQERAPDPLQLLSQAQQQYTRPPSHLPIPPQYARPPPGMYDAPPHDPTAGYPPFIRPPPPGPFPNVPPGYLPPPQFFQRPPPPMPAGFAPRPPQYNAHLGPAQQDMLATLFSGLGPRN
ncbi:hypothetical protein CI109_105292 [Kwoniella shandongensis]|uniref:Uncharacterized protein n=1 Tax=Kwoniella shandongensis TaxID=1734106 RepID=A0AAJ8MYM4_9TREE